MSLPTSALISAQQLQDYFVHKSANQESILIIDASMPPVGGGTLPDQRWPDVTLPNARRMDINNVFSDANAEFPHTLLSPQDFQEQCRQLGMNNEHHVVVYDDLGLFSAARAWWMLKAMGQEKVSVLDGGLPAWLANNGEVSVAIDAPYKLGNFTSQHQPNYFCDHDYVAKALQSHSHLVLDARAANRFYGKAPEPRAGVRAGHMPNALNLPYANLLDNGAFKSLTELIKFFSTINPEQKPMIMSCGSGITACILALAATLAGNTDITVYDGSWTEWGSLEQLPVVTD
ncbi:sulfurtransferase [Thalassotalea sp. M1531]|uniref:Sulfurtransferase n=1 Tax=Thalassotalea algicola TaxID=2716224 RepID=A0A7Y0LA81_9GAMM|nr:sulfurtransferase [Thalassotalea algicola]NMP30372.1 sulfurtransferase [Thalassotalea algicola]